jgi:hypothetical protein
VTRTANPWGSGHLPRGFEADHERNWDNPNPDSDGDGDGDGDD